MSVRDEKTVVTVHQPAEPPVTMEEDPDHIEEIKEKRVRKMNPAALKYNQETKFKRLRHLNRRLEEIMDKIQELMDFGSDNVQEVSKLFGTWCQADSSS